MCTLMVLYRRHPEFWLIAAANRDERMDRPSLPPGVIRSAPPAIGGKDLLSGGTWLGLNSEALFAAVTNARGGAPTADRRSRGLLVLDALGADTPALAAAGAHETAGRYNPFNLLVLGPHEGFAVDAGPEGARRQAIPPGAVALASGESNDARGPGIARAIGFLEGLESAGEAEIVRRLQEACADHREAPDAPPFCLHRPPFGTVSSTLLLLRADGSGRYLFAPGPPCTTPYEEYSRLLPVGR